MQLWRGGSFSGRSRFINGVPYTQACQRRKDGRIYMYYVKELSVRLNERIVARLIWAAISIM